MIKLRYELGRSAITAWYVQEVLILLFMQYYGKENTLDSRSHQLHHPAAREDFSEYVAHLQLHMALQARNLVPTLTQTSDSREQLLHQTQANIEKMISRQMFSR
jgi:hypothetical protein